MSWSRTSAAASWTASGSGGTCSARSTSGSSKPRSRATGRRGRPRGSPASTRSSRPGPGPMAAQGGADDPVFHMIAYTDYSAGTLGALATVAALLARERTGRGQRVDVSLFRTGYVAQAAETIDGGVGGRDHRGPAACRRIYP